MTDERKPWEETYGLLTVVGAAPTRNRCLYVSCRCACGATKTVALTNLRRGRTRSCGCAIGQHIAAARATHGHAREGARTPEYEAWKHMLRRCASPKDKRWADYGGRGIRVCDQCPASKTSSRTWAPGHRPITRWTALT